jgi:carbonic anhydrase
MADNKYSIPELIQNNRAWAREIQERHPGFFGKLAKQQSPGILWIGCSDSRVPANEVVGLLPGEVFVHRNVANQVMHVDFNCLAVMQYAVEVLRVARVIVCGHYGCGGIQASLRRFELGLVENWLYGVGAIKQKHQARIDAICDAALHTDLLCEINVIEQVRNVCHTSIVQQAWRRGQDLAVHGLIYGIEDGHLHDLGVTITEAGDIDGICDRAIAAPRLVHRAKAEGTERPA